MSSAAIAGRVLPWMLLVACSVSKPIERPTPARELTRAPSGAALPSVDLYGPDEALRDVLSGALEHVGTGRWPGIERSFACVFRNPRVLVVNTYCARTEAPALRVDVYSPGRGRMRLYAEAEGPISSRDRARYFSFVAASEPPPGPDAPVGVLALSMTFDELRRYEQKRYDAYLPGCFAGEQNSEAVKGCLGTLAPHAEPWALRNREFLARASSDWYRVVRVLRELSTRYGKDPREP